MGSKQYQERVISEHYELCNRLGRLSEYIESPTFLDLGEDEQWRMQAQRMAMELYAHILFGRISNF